MATVLNNERYRGCLPSSFLFGAASAAHQIEGCIDADGKGENVWDVALADREGRNGKDACDSYRQWRQDVQLLKKYGMNCYRFSISWARIIPLGGKDDEVNEAGIQYYSELIDALLSEGIEPIVTIFHWDLPQTLQDRYGGFADPERMVPDFVRYAAVCFERFGDRVRRWITINEPHIFTMFAGMTFMKDTFDVHTDYTRLAKSLLLCHGSAVERYRQDYMGDQRGRIGIALDADWTEPIDDSAEAKAMQQKYLDLVLGLYADPIFKGEYSSGLYEEYGSTLPAFSAREKALILHSSDFFALNHYGTSYSTGKRISPEDAGEAGLTWSFGRTEKVFERDGVQIGVRGQNGHPYDVPWGFRKILNYISETYTATSGIPIWITENGMGVENEATFSLDGQIHDVVRQAYYAGYIEAMLQAIVEDGIMIDGYMAWSLLDNLEWLEGYTPRFGLTVVDRQDNFRRYPKDSAFLLRTLFGHAISK